MAIVESTSVLGTTKFDLMDWSERWARARRAAILGVLGAGPTDLNEHELLAQVQKTDRADLLRSVFDNSRRFGRSTSRHMGLTWEVGDFREVVERLGNPCVRGEWSGRPQAEVVRRNGCADVKGLGYFLCDYWREAFDGLVVGLGEDERFTRHQSVGHGDSECVDLFFLDQGSHRSLQDRWQPIPEDWQQILAPIEEDFLKNFGTRVSFLGVAEGVLYCQRKAVKSDCGSTGKIVWNYLNERVLGKIQGVVLKDVSPVSVLGTEA